jgi:hypothetical protein
MRSLIMTRFRVLPYRQGSKGAKALATALGGKVLKLEGSSFIPKAGDKIINWGNVQPTSSAFPGYYAGPSVQYFNPPAIIKGASNKLLFFRMMRDAGHSDIIPEFWEKSDEIPETAYPIVCRTILAGHSGDGIVIANTHSDLVDAGLFVRYVKKELEFRIHVGQKDGQTAIISVQRKARNKDIPNEEVNWQVRNHQNGFVYVRQGVNPPSSVLDVARAALLASGLDFGAVDVIYNTQQEKAYVLEINTAPGLEGTTVTDYAAFFKGGV